jgi:hypothetical protein
MTSKCHTLFLIAFFSPAFVFFLSMFCKNLVEASSYRLLSSYQSNSNSSTLHLHFNHAIDTSFSILHSSSVGDSDSWDYHPFSLVYLCMIIDSGFIYEALFLFWQMRAFPVDLFSVHDSCRLLLGDIQLLWPTLAADGLEKRKDFLLRTGSFLEDIMLT